MSKSEVQKCPECGGEMLKGSYIWGYGFVPIRFLENGDRRGDNIFPFYCMNCGFVKLCKEIE